MAGWAPRLLRRLVRKSTLACWRSRCRQVLSPCQQMRRRCKEVRSQYQQVLSRYRQANSQFHQMLRQCPRRAAALPRRHKRRDRAVDKTRVPLSLKSNRTENRLQAGGKAVADLEGG